MRWKCTVAYDGTDFSGWQSQPGGNTVQDHIERRLAFLFKGPVRIHGAGRTDTGVHATGQVFHFDGLWKHGGAALVEALRVGFPKSIQVTDAMEVSTDFHARFSATGKRYSYSFFEGHAPPMETRYRWSLGRRRLDTAAMKAAAAVLVGRHDFSAFAANPRDDRVEDAVKDLRRLDVMRDGPRVELITEASGYLYRMVRGLAGCLADVGTGKLTSGEVRAILEGGERTNRVVTAPAQGLCLREVFYADDGRRGRKPSSGS